MSPGHDDVRMRGFRERTPVADVLAWIDEAAGPLEAETTPLDAAAGRVLAADVVAPVDVPPFDRAAMDGWAVRGEDTFGASDVDPVRLRVIGAALPGRPFAGVVERGQAVRIMTGAPLPEGADAVLRAEDGREEGEALSTLAPTAPRRHVGAVGEDVRAGTRVLARGRRLRPQDLGVAASVGLGALEVVRTPRVRLLVTGDEIVPPGQRPDGARIADANGPMLRALVARDGGRLEHLRRLPDDRDRLEAEIGDGDEDVLLVSGGSSVGQEDHAPGLVAARGSLAFHGVALRPAAPAGGGRLGDRLVFLLPGNPVSCLCAYDLFAGRAVRRLAGGDGRWPYASVRRPLAGKIASALGRMDYVRVRLADGAVHPLMSRGASVLTSTTEADGFVLVPQDSEGYAAGAAVRVWGYDAPSAAEDDDAAS